jgi:tetrahydromethanopterin S-methyltransferase subunit A
MMLKKKFDDAAGKVCKTLIPVKLDYFEGNGREIAICTLGSIDLLEQISESILMDKVAIAGRLLSENKGIDSVINYVSVHPQLKRIIVCGREVKGHLAGQALLALHMNGIDGQGRIIGAKSPYPILQSSRKKVETFRRQIAITDMTGIIDLQKIARLLTT